jgi:hypothetical protein
MYIYINIYIYIYIYIFSTLFYCEIPELYFQLKLYVCKCMCIYVCIYIFIYSYMYVHRCMFIHIYINIYINTPIPCSTVKSQNLTSLSALPVTNPFPNNLYKYLNTFVHWNICDDIHINMYKHFIYTYTSVYIYINI